MVKSKKSTKSLHPSVQVRLGAVVSEESILGLVMAILRGVL